MTVGDEVGFLPIDVAALYEAQCSVAFRPRKTHMKLNPKHLKRYKELAKILWKYGRSDLVQNPTVAFRI
jgi:hypothetical protein